MTSFSAIDRHAVVGVLLVVGLLSGCAREERASLLNVSYDTTREFYHEFNRAFEVHWEKTTGQRVAIRQSHGGSGKQARSVIDGLPAHVVSLGCAYDIDAIAARTGLLPTNWATRLPNNSAPFTSTIVFLVREGNPKGIRDWPDLVKPGVSIITPNPKSSGGARWNYLAAYGAGLRRTGGDHERARAFVSQLFKNVAVLDSGARGSSISFLQRGMGDVLIAWENEALTARQEMPPGKVELIVPSVSILAEPPVALLDKNVNRDGNRELATAYLAFLYSETGQQIAARHHLRPRIESAAGTNQFTQLSLFTVDEMFGGWQRAQKIHFANGGVFDQLFTPH